LKEIYKKIFKKMMSMNMLTVFFLEMHIDCDRHWRGKTFSQKSVFLVLFAQGFL